MPFCHPPGLKAALPPAWARGHGSVPTSAPREGGGRVGELGRGAPTPRAAALGQLRTATSPKKLDSRKTQRGA